MVSTREKKQQNTGLFKHLDGSLSDFVSSSNTQTGGAENETVESHINDFINYGGATPSENNQSQNQVIERIICDRFRKKVDSVCADVKNQIHGVFLTAVDSVGYQKFKWP